MLVVFACLLRAPFQLSCVDMHEGLVFSAEQRDMPDGIAVKDTAARLPNRGRLQKIIAPQQDDQV